MDEPIADTLARLLSRDGAVGSPLRIALAEYATVYLAARNLAPRTRIEYTNDLLDAVAFFARRCQLTTPEQVERRHLEAYLAELDVRGFKGTTRRRKVASLRSFFGWLEDQGTLPSSPARQLIPPGREHHEPRVLTQTEYKRLLEAVKYQPRDAAIIELVLQTGMRLSEIARLTSGQLELPAKATQDALGAVHIHGKGRKTRTVTLNSKACRALKAYLAVRLPLATDRVFLSKFREPLGPRAIEDVVTKYLAEAGIADASIHSLRHTFATHHIKNGTSIRTVQEALGHASLATTSVYVHLARELMDRELQQNAL